MISIPKGRLKVKERTGKNSDLTGRCIMGTIQWESAWDIGHGEIDAQHRHWVQLFNELEDAFLSEKNIDMAEVQQKTFKEMLHYTRYHFACEEKLMQNTAYPDVPGHWRLHKEFDNRVYEQYRQFTDSGLVLTSELLSLIRSWLLRHIQVEDKKLSRYLADTDTIAG